MSDQLENLVDQFTRGRIGRRQFVAGGLKLGVALSSINFILAACEAATSGGSKKDQIVVAVPATAAGLDPEIHAGAGVSDTLQALGLGLTAWRRIPSAENKGGWDVDWNAKDFKAATDSSLASSYDISPDGRTYTFKLRQGVKSSFGNELTSADVKWRWDRAFALKAIGSFFNTVMLIDKPESVEAVDKYTVRFTVRQPTPDFLLSMNDTFRLFIHDSTEAQKHATSDDPWAKNWLKDHAASYGPYKLDAFSPGTEVRMVANSASINQPKIKNLLFKVISDSSERVSLLTKGQVDIARDLSPTELNSLRSTAGVRIWSFPGELMLAATLVTDFAPLNNIKVRQALSYATPYSAIVQDVYHGIASPSYGPLVKQAAGFDKSIFPYTTDYDKAKALLAEAGLANGFSTTFTYSQADPVGELVGVQLKTSFQKIGVNLELQGLPSAQASESLTKGKSPMGFFNLGADQPDPQYVLTLFFNSSSTTNWSHYKNAEVDRIIQETAGVQDWQARLAADRRAMQMVVNDAAWIWMAQPGEHTATRTNVTGFNWYGGRAVRWELVDFV